MACTCILNHPQRSYCNSEIVLKLKIHEATRTVSGSQAEKCYKVRVEKVLKGNVALKSLNSICTKSGTDCEYVHLSTNFHKDYLITASNNQGNISVSSCSYSVSWDELLHKQKKGVEGAYNKGCTCDIISCASRPCSTPQKTCAIEEYKGGDSENQLKNQVCVPVNSTTCRWKRIE
ncbi:hypothetical protein NDU88_000969 [Pleurodeles waltl]|uniref:NTR domain-containing protein n=2 Tax=Pleurodeles waltl TaxID=8319 RepID=A0AAV7LYD4_PLEWA|nr:hypothetical protein NDU88_000969 [Pleurodeles waltl]